MKYDPSSLKWGISDKSDRLVAAFSDQDSATAFHKTSFNGQGQVINLTTGQPVSQRELTEG